MILFVTFEGNNLELSALEEEQLQIVFQAYWTVSHHHLVWIIITIFIFMISKIKDHIHYTNRLSVSRELLLILITIQRKTFYIVLQ